MTPEEKARQQINAMFVASGWAVQTKDKIQLFAARGVAICETSFGTGEPDHTLFVDGKAIGRKGFDNTAAGARRSSSSPTVRATRGRPSSPAGKLAELPEEIRPGDRPRISIEHPRRHGWANYC